MPSPVWNYYKKLSNQVARCNACDKLVKTGGGTTNMRNHLRGKHPQELLELEELEKTPKSKEQPKFIWSPQVLQEFVRQRKDNPELFTDSLSSYDGWEHILSNMGLTDRVTPQMAETKWDSLVVRYRTLRKSIDDPSAKKRKSVWKMFEVMDFAHKAGVFSLGEEKEATEVSEVTLDLEHAAEPIDETINAANYITVESQYRYDPERQELIKVVAPVDQVAATEAGSSQQQNVYCTVRQNKRCVTPVPEKRLSAHRAAAMLMDASEQRQVDALLLIRRSLEELVKLQKATLETNQLQQQTTERLTEAVERQATALERLVELAATKVDPTINDPNISDAL